MKFMTVCVRFSEFVKDSEDSENSNLFVFVHIKFEMFEFVWEGKIWRMTPLVPKELTELEETTILFAGRKVHWTVLGKTQDS